MPEYTPTTDEVRAAASRAIGGDWFDRWLTAHDVKVREYALKEAEGLTRNAICNEKGDWNNGWDDCARFLVGELRRVGGAV